MLSIRKATHMIQVSDFDGVGLLSEIGKSGTKTVKVLGKTAVGRFFLVAGFFMVGPGFALDEAEDVEDLAAPPPIPPKIVREQVEPSVVIRKEEENIIEEYSINGQIYMVKVTPENGLPYYYFDEDGDGQLELQPGDEALNPVRPVYWKLKEWK